MPLSIFINMTITAALSVWTPGPNNILLLSSTSKFGFKKNIRFMCGILTGSLCLMISCGLFTTFLANIIPNIRPVMMYFGASYLLYLAYKTLTRRPPKENEQDKEPTYLQGVFLQLINVKIIIYGLTMFSSFILPYVTKTIYLPMYACYLSTMGVIGNLIWALAGNILKSTYEKHYKIMNIFMTALLIWCVFRLFL